MTFPRKSAAPTIVPATLGKRKSGMDMACIGAIRPAGGVSVLPAVFAPPPPHAGTAARAITMRHNRIQTLYGDMVCFLLAMVLLALRRGLHLARQGAAKWTLKTAPCQV